MPLVNWLLNTETPNDNIIKLGKTILKVNVTIYIWIVSHEINFFPYLYKLINTLGYT